MNPAIFDKDYYENGVQKRISGYTNYHWRPEYVLPMANWIRERFGTAKTMDFGCAKGYLVRALRMLGVDAWGYDISDYAVESADQDVAQYLRSKKELVADPYSGWGSNEFSTIIAKDTLEHVPYSEIDQVLDILQFYLHSGGHAFIVVPLGENGSYRIREYELDATHCIREDEVWWIGRFAAHGFKTVGFHYALPGVKDHWTKAHPHGNGMFTLEKP